MTIDPVKTGRQHAIFGEGVKQAAQRGDVSDQAGKDQRQQRKHQRRHAEGSQVMPRRVERRKRFDPFQVPQVPDVGQPGIVFGRIRGHGEQHHADVQERGRQDHDHQDAENFCSPEGKLLHAVGNAFKADERPRGDAGDLDDLRRRAAVRQKSRRQGRIAAKQSTDEADQDPQRKQHRHADHAAGNDPFKTRAEEGKQQHTRNGEQGFSKINVVAENGIELSKLEDPAQKIPGEQRQRPLYWFLSIQFPNQNQEKVFFLPKGGDQ